MGSGPVPGSTASLAHTSALGRGPKQPRFITRPRSPAVPGPGERILRASRFTTCWGGGEVPSDGVFSKPPPGFGSLLNAASGPDESLSVRPRVAARPTNGISALLPLHHFLSCTLTLPCTHWSEDNVYELKVPLLCGTPFQNQQCQDLSRRPAANRTPGNQVRSPCNQLL